jgi:hypothetical protein
MADNLPPSSADVTESGSLNLPEPFGPHRPVMGMLYLTRYYIQILMKLEFSRPNFMKTSLMGAQLFHADRQTDEQDRHDETYTSS